MRGWLNDIVYVEHFAQFLTHSGCFFKLLPSLCRWTCLPCWWPGGCGLPVWHESHMFVSLLLNLCLQPYWPSSSFRESSVPSISLPLHPCALSHLSQRPQAFSTLLTDSCPFGFGIWAPQKLPPHFSVNGSAETCFSVLWDLSERMSPRALWL